MTIVEEMLSQMTAEKLVKWIAAMPFEKDINKQRTEIIMSCKVWKEYHDKRS